MAVYSGAGIIGTDNWFTLYGQINLNSQNVAGNYSVIQVLDWIAYDRANGGNVYSSGATANVGGVVTYSTGFSYNMNFGNTLYIYNGAVTVYHDANGNYSNSLSGSVNMNNAPYAGTGSYSGNWSLPRIALAPSFSEWQTGTIGITTAQLVGAISSEGHGTSWAMEAYIAPVSTGSYVAQGQAGGGTIGAPVTWDVSNLAPSTEYEYYFTAWNNNGDTATSPTNTFTTLPAPSGVSAAMEI